MPGKQKLEVWGGFECSVVRIGPTFRNQAEETGHVMRLDDLDRAHALGLRTLRYPALWETISPEDPDQCEWGWHDERFERLRRLGMRPIAGLLHHGSGPRYTSLVDPSFPELLARHAERVARRYPWIDAWTPVNEPLTTARFSALYGHWYPHRTDMAGFLSATVHQCKATVLAMRAIRRIVPQARLIQTEDIGKIFGKPDLAEQVDFENGRRWLSLDLLCGRVDRHHPWRGVLSSHGISDADLDLFLEADAAPDIIGVNHYLTSERFLDREWHRYPAQFRGGNGVQDYADVEAVRIALPAADLGPKVRLREVVQRYGRPVAITEAHHGCSREEQLRWLADVWNAAAELKAEGADVRAVTVWSLAGAVDWNSLLTSRRGAYEPGAMDVRSPSPRRTALGKAVASFAKSGGFTHPALGLGWWRRPERLYRSSDVERPRHPLRRARPLLIVDGTGALGQAFARICAIRGLPYEVVPSTGSGLSEAGGAAEALEARRPWAVVDAEGADLIARPGQDAGAGAIAALNATEALTRACRRHGVPLVTFSSPLVFDGRLGRPYVESDVPCPGGTLGASAMDKERAVMALHPAAIVVRAGPLFGPWEQGDHAGAMPTGLAGGGSPPTPHTLVSPTYLPDLAHATLDLLIDGERGLWHLANAGLASWAAFTLRLSDAAGGRRIEPTISGSGDAVRNLALASEKAWIMPTLDDAIDRYWRDFDADRRAASSRMAAE